ncbi:MAG TPA: type II toxin-antitoxin system mRNA interferase toxin, RelE/StbE family [Blastocatellia bacterium]|nr:type II toxin-antitoxin system mRNA interferase toxin, RelE/StbE family [Blastocatellia bacterium]
MANYELQIKPSAVKEIERLPRKDRPKIVQKICMLAADPRPQGCEKLSADEKYRVRQGDYRVVYSVDDNKRRVFIVKIGHRKEVYR